MALHLPDEARFLHHHVGAVFQLAGRQRIVVAAGGLLRTGRLPEWQRAALVPMFALFYVVLAPFVGAFCRCALPKRGGSCS